MVHTLRAKLRTVNKEKDEIMKEKENDKIKKERDKLVLPARPFQKQERV